MIDKHKFIPSRLAPSICDGCAYPAAHEIHGIGLPPTAPAGPDHVMDSDAHPVGVEEPPTPRDLAPIIELRTPAVMSALEKEAYRDAAHEEALNMLRRMTEIITGERAAGRRCSGVVIAVVFEDGSYGRLLPDGAENCGTLLGAIENAKLEFHSRVQ